MPYARAGELPFRRFCASGCNSVQLSLFSFRVFRIVASMYLINLIFTGKA
jgi:hypothetical protein